MKKCDGHLLKVLAIIIPFYVVYYWRLSEQTQRKEIKTLWKYVIAGFLVYIILLIIIMLYQ